MHLFLNKKRKYYFHRIQNFMPVNWLHFEFLYSSCTQKNFVTMQYEIKQGK